MLLADQTCLVTGSSRGIGRAIARDLAANGADVVVNYRTSGQEAAEVVESIREDGGNAVAVQGNVAEMGDVERMYAEVDEAFGSIDALVNNAGVTDDTTASHRGSSRRTCSRKSPTTSGSASSSASR
jgi:3-oxoacyl-[acyl-carrier protein] reductase